MFVKLLLAHLLGDFLLQPRRALIHKQARKAASPFFYLHVGIHFGLAWLLLWTPSGWKPALVVALSHGVIDLAKLYTEKRYKRVEVPFLLDQAAHLAVLGAVASYPHTLEALQGMLQQTNWALVTGLFFVTYPAAILNARLLEGLSRQIQWDHASLPGAGMYIGILERLLVFLFILLDHWEAIGLLIAAKSVFRFNDLKEQNNRKWTEYILIGTLLSFGMAICAGLLARMG